MPSEESKALADTFAHIQKTTEAHLDLFMQAPFRRYLWEDIQILTSEPTDVTYAEAQCPGTVRPAIWCYPIHASKEAVMLYFHGGGFITGSPSSHRKMAAHLAKAAGVTALLVDYRKAPEHPYPAALEDGVAAYKWLVEIKGFDPKKIVTAGDSAGGNLATTVPLKAREVGLPLPGAVLGLSPWYDLEVKGKALETNKGTDTLIEPNAIKMMVDMYTSPTKTSPKDPLLNPLYADLKGFPPTMVTCGTYEGLQDNPAMFADVARKQGVEVVVDEAEGMQHVHTIMAGRAPEADKTIQDAAKFIKEKLGL